MNETTTHPSPSPSTAASTAPKGKTGLSDAFRTHFAGDAPITQKATNFAKARPWTAAAFAGVAAMAIANTFRGRV